MITTRGLFLELGNNLQTQTQSQIPSPNSITHEDVPNTLPMFDLLSFQKDTSLLNGIVPFKINQQIQSHLKFPQNYQFENTLPFPPYVTSS